MRRTIILLAVSAKHHNLCVAGIDVSTNSYIRLVSDDEDCGYAIHKEDFRYSFENGHIPNKLSVVSVETSDCPMFCSGAQVENYLFIPSEGVGYCGKKVANSSLFPVLSDLPYGSLANYLTYNEYITQDHSIEVLHVSNLVFHNHINEEGKRKYRVSFVLDNNCTCTEYSMTDRKYFGDGLDGVVIDEAFIVITIGGNDGMGSAKFVSSIMEVIKDV